MATIACVPMAATYAAGISQQDGSMEHSECTSREHDLSWRHTTTAHSADKQSVLLQPSTRHTTAPARCSPAVLDVLAGTYAPLERCQEPSLPSEQA